MKTQLVKNITSSLLFGCALVSLVAATASGQGRRDGTSGGRIEGTWNVQVNIIDCNTHQVLNTFPSMGMFMAGGTMLDSTSGIPPASRTPGTGVWRHTSGNNYVFRFKAFNFNMNVFAGWTIVEHEATLDMTGNAYTSSGTAEIYAPNGVLVATGCSSTVATRFDF